MKRFQIFLLFFLTFGLVINVSVFAQDKRTALVIGNSDYTVSPLKNPVNDAADMSFILKKLGFDVISALDCDRSEMRGAIRSFYKQVKGSDVGLFYYAGHGIQLNGENYLVPVNSDITEEFEVEDQCVKVSSVLSAMGAAKNSINIVILDACRNNPFATSYRSGTRGLAKMNAPVGTFLAYATAPGSVALDTTTRGLTLKYNKTKPVEKGNGLYTAKLLKYIVQPELSIEDVFKRVRVEVMTDTNNKQIPWESSSLTTDFSFGGSNELVSILSTPDQEYMPVTPVVARKRYYFNPKTDEYELYEGVRFKSESGNRIKDNKYDCIWYVVNDKIFSVDDAQTYCDKKKGYRLPTSDELQTLLTRDVDEGEWGHIDGRFFSAHARLTKYWTSSQLVPLWPMSSKTFVDFKTGKVDNMSGSNSCAIILIKE